MIGFDIEVAPNFTSLAAVSHDKREEHHFFCVHESLDQRQEYIEYLHNIILNNEILVTYNGLEYDYPVIHRILTNERYFLSASVSDVTAWVYNVSKHVITRQASRIQTPLIRQYDLYKIYHFDNKARATSLKKLQAVLRRDRVADLPFAHDQLITAEMIPMIKDYNIGDVLDTLAVLDRALSEGKIDTRVNVLPAEYPGIDFTNMSDVAIGEAILVYEIEKEQGFSIPNPQYKQFNSFKIQDILLKNLHFNDPQFKKVYNFFASNVVTSTKGSFPLYSCKVSGLEYFYGQGGIHGSVSNKIVSSDDEYSIVDWDVSSFYPNIAIVNDIHPSHVGKIFNVVYKRIYDKRASIPKSNPMNGSYKLSLNGAFGKSGDGFSKLFDPKTTMSITINGQLLLSMFIDMIITTIGQDVEVIQANTDGCTLRIKKTREQDMLEIVDRWQSMTHLMLERADYSKMIISDVNNYMAIKIDGKVKYKGRFEIDRELHKNPSNRIIAIAVANYFINNISPEETITTHLLKTEYPNIPDDKGKPIVAYGAHDFFSICRAKPSPDKGMAYFYLWSVDNGAVVKTKLQKLNRYYYCKSKSSKIIKVYEDGSSSSLDKDRVGHAMANDLRTSPIDASTIDFDVYIKRAYKIINNFSNSSTVKNVSSSQLNLF